MDDVRHCFSLGKIQAVVEKCALGVFTGRCGDGTSGKTMIQQGGNDSLRAVRIKLYQIFAGVRAGRREKDGQAEIQQRAVFGVKFAVMHGARLTGGEGKVSLHLKNLIGDLFGQGAGKAHGGNGTRHGAGAAGSNGGCIHKRTSRTQTSHKIIIPQKAYCGK